MSIDKLISKRNEILQKIENFYQRKIEVYNWYMQQHPKKTFEEITEMIGMRYQSDEVLDELKKRISENPTPIPLEPFKRKSPITVKQKVYSLLKDNPEMSIDEVIKTLNISRGTAHQYVSSFKLTLTRREELIKSMVAQYRWYIQRFPKKSFTEITNIIGNDFTNCPDILKRVRDELYTTCIPVNNTTV